MIRRIAAVLALLLAIVGGVAGPARADTSGEIQAGCDHTLPAMGSAGYYVTQGGVEYGVSITIGWQYVGGSASNCEDINVGPRTENGDFWTHGVIKVRTYMCGSSGCYHNAWRNCQGGCQAATDMANGTQYQVHFYGGQSPGFNIHEYD